MAQVDMMRSGLRAFLEQVMRENQGGASYNDMTQLNFLAEDLAPMFVEQMSYAGVVDGHEVVFSYNEDHQAFVVDTGGLDQAKADHLRYWLRKSLLAEGHEFRLETETHEGLAEAV